MESISKKEEIDLLIKLLSYISNNPKNLERVMMVIGNAIDAKYMLFSYTSMSENEEITPEVGEFKTRLTTKVDNGTETLTFANDGSDWLSPCHLAFGVMAALTTMVRNNVMDNCSEENMNSYAKFIKIMQQSAKSGTEAISYSNWNKDLEEK